MTSSLPFGASELIAFVAGAARVLDAGCGSGRLTVALAQTEADVTGADTNTKQLAVAGRRAGEAGVDLRLVEADFDGRLPFDDAAFDAVVSRLALMAAADPAGTLVELRRVLVRGGRLATVLWASPEENPWFDTPRQAIGATLGKERASFARAFGKLGSPEEAAAVHRAAGLGEVAAIRLHELRTSPGVPEYWDELSTENGHFRRIASGLSDNEHEQLLAELEQRLGPYREGDLLALPRTLVLVTSRSL